MPHTIGANDAGDQDQDQSESPSVRDKDQDQEQDQDVAMPAPVEAEDGEDEEEEEPSNDAAPNQRAVLARTDQEGVLQGWVREDRQTAKGRRYSVWISPQHAIFDSRTAALRSIGAEPEPKPSAVARTEAPQLFGRPSRKRRSRSRRVVAVMDPEEGDGGDAKAPRAPRRSYIGPAVPVFGRVPAGEDLPGWTVERRETMDGASLLLYRDPSGKEVGSRGAALFITGQLEVPRTHRQLARHLVREGDVHLTLLEQPLRLPPSTKAAFNAAPASDWRRGELPARIEATMGKLSRERAAADSAPGPGPAPISRRVAVLDLFCGVGGLSLGLRTAGFGHIFGVDVESGCIAAYRRNLCGERSMEQRIRLDDVEKWAAAINKARYVDGEPRCEYILAAAPPCQPFSCVGMQSGASDDRACLLTVVELILRTRPLVAIIENVPNMMDSAFADHVQPLLGRMQDEGYIVRATIHGVARHSVAQKRRRLLLTALRISNGFRPEQHLNVPRSSASREPRAADAIDDVSVWKGETPPELRVRLTTLRSRQRLRRECEVTGLVNPYEQSPTVVTTSLVDHTYFRLLAVPTDVPEERLCYKHLRALATKHVLALQSFPTDFVLYGHARFQSTCIGNAVPPMLAHDVGIGLAALLEECTGSALLCSASEDDVRACLVEMKHEVHARIDP